MHGIKCFLIGLMVWVAATVGEGATMDYGIFIDGKALVELPKFEGLSVKESNYARFPQLEALTSAKALRIKMKGFDPKHFHVFVRSMAPSNDTEEITGSLSDGDEKNTYVVKLKRAPKAGELLIAVYAGELERGGGVGGAYVAVGSTVDILPYIEKAFVERKSELATSQLTGAMGALRAFPNSKILKQLSEEKTHP